MPSGGNTTRRRPPHITSPAFTLLTPSGKRYSGVQEEARQAAAGEQCLHFFSSTLSVKGAWVARDHGIIESWTSPEYSIEPHPAHLKPEEHQAQTWDEETEAEVDQVSISRQRKVRLGKTMNIYFASSSTRDCLVGGRTTTTESRRGTPTARHRTRAARSKIASHTARLAFPWYHPQPSTHTRLQEGLDKMNCNHIHHKGSHERSSPSEVRREMS